MFRGKVVSMIFQDALVALNPTVNIGTQIIENLENHNSDKLSRTQMLQRAREMLECVGIPDAGSRLRQYPHSLSGGMRQRVMIAAAIITHPELLIADEATTALDVTIQAQIISLLQQLQKQLGMGILMITHNLGIVAEIADDILVMYAGKIVEHGNSSSIFYNPRHPYTWALLHASPRPDTKRKQPLFVIEGAPPNMICPPEGCPFCARCPYAMQVCVRYEPPTVHLENNHTVSCWLTDPRADSSGIPFRTGDVV